MKNIMITYPSGGGKSTGLEKVIKNSGLEPHQVKILMFPKKRTQQWNKTLKTEIFPKHQEQNVFTQVANNIHSDAWHFLGMTQENFYRYMPVNDKDFKLYQKSRMMKYFTPTADEEKIIKSVEKKQKIKKGDRMDHDDYLLYAIDQVKKGAIEPNNHVKLIGIDEFQLLSYRHFEYIDTIYPNARKVYLGDLNQMILGFALVEHKWIKEFKDSCEVKTQNKIYRHGNKIKNSCFRTFRCSQQKVINPEDYVTDYHNEGEVQRVSHFLDIDIDDTSDYIIVARDNYIFMKIQKYLRRQNINHVFIKSGNNKNFGDAGSYRDGEGDPERVRLGTVWQFSGAEASKVIVLYDLARMSFFEAAKPENLEEQLNIIYTMKSRARDKLYLVDSMTKMGYDKIQSLKEGLY